MSFAYRIKNEIASNRPFRQHYKKAQAYGLLLYGKMFDAQGISIHTEHKSVARLFADSIADLVGITDSITLREVKRNGKRSMFVVTVDSPSDREAVLRFFGYVSGEDTGHILWDNLSAGEIPAFLSGVFLACAAVTDPEKSYHVEFCIPGKSLCDDLYRLLCENLAEPKITVRRNDYILYYKESEHIEDLLTYIGAGKASLEMMEVKIVKELRNKVNRATNCETANITKVIDASMKQTQDIRLIAENGGLEALDEDLRELARLRMENPEMSLRELGENLSEKISRSGVNHRLKRIAQFAQEIRIKQGGA